MNDGAGGRLKTVGVAEVAALEQPFRGSLE
jgi:hypothetical protein